MKTPRLNIPAHTPINAIGSRVTIDFFTEAEADEFIEFIKWITEQPGPISLVSVQQKYGLPQ